MPDQPREFALHCPHCGEENPPEFPVCWSCHGDLPAAAGRPEEEPASAATEPARAPAEARPRRKRIAFEVAVAMVVVWLPWLAGGIWNAFDPAPPRTWAVALGEVVHAAGILVLLAYFAWLDGDWRRLLGLERPRLRKELTWGAAAFLAVVVASWLTDRIAQVLDLEAGQASGREFAPELSWFVPLHFLIWAAVEEAFYRAYLWNRLTELSGRPTLSMAIASVLFSAAHVYPAAWSLSVLFFGLTLAGIFRARRSLWPLVLAHWAFNVFVAG